MALQCARFSSEPDIVRASTNSPPLRRGSHGDGVHVVQLALIDLGFAMPISTKNGASLPDGVLRGEGGGERTRAAAQTERGPRNAMANNPAAPPAKIACPPGGAPAPCHTGTQFAL